MTEYAVALNFDSRGTARLLGLMCGNYMYENGIRPHLTLGIFRAGSEVDAAKALFAAGSKLSSFDVDFTAVGAFRGGCIFCSPAQNDQLSRSYRIVLNEFVSRDMPPGANGRYTPGRWIPHAAVAYKLVSDFGGCLEYVKRMFRPFECSAKELVLASLEPYTELYTVKLKQEELK